MKKQRIKKNEVRSPFSVFFSGLWGSVLESVAGTDMGEIKMLHCGCTSNCNLRCVFSFSPQGYSSNHYLFFLIYMIFLPTHLFVWTSAWKNVKHLKMLLREEKKSMYVTFTWQPSKVVKAIRTRRPLVCLAVICSWSPRLPTTPWVSCIMQQQFWLKSKNLLTECSVGHLGRCLINYYNWHPHQMSDIWQSLCW